MKSVSERNREYYLANKERCKARVKSWRADNPDKHKAAMSRYNRKVRIRLREETRVIVREAKSVPCADCGVKYPYYVMDFDHRDPPH